MISPEFLVVALMACVALLIHRYILNYVVATFIAGYFGGLPSLVVFDLVGGSRTEFAVFNMFILIVIAYLVSAAVGVPFMLWRRSKGLPVLAAWPIKNANRISWPMLGGMALAMTLALCVLWALTAADMAAQNASAAQQPENGSNALKITIVSVLAAAAMLVSAFISAIFSFFSALAGCSKVPPRKHEFLIGFNLAFVLGALLVTSKMFVPDEWNEGVHQLTFALWVNWLLLVPAIAGTLYGRRQKHLLI